MERIELSAANINLSDIVKHVSRDRVIVELSEGHVPLVATRPPPLVTSDGIRGFASSASMEKSVLRGRIEG